MGHFLRIEQCRPDVDLHDAYQIVSRREYAYAQCEHEDGSERCQIHTNLRPDSQGRRHCYFHHEDTRHLVGTVPLFDQAMKAVYAGKQPFEEECSPQYYCDVVNYLLANRSQIDTVMEIGCYQGGFTGILAQVAHELGMAYYVIELDPRYLLFTHERVGLLAPASLQSIRFYRGTLTQFIDEHSELLRNRNAMLVMDGPHNYEGVLTDLAASHRIRDHIHSIAAHDFHLRSANWRNDVFVDRAIFSVFGFDAPLIGIGFNTGDWVGDPDADRTEYKLYNKPNCPEGVIISLAENSYCMDRVLPSQPSIKALVATITREGRRWLGAKRRTWFPDRKASLPEPERRTGISCTLPAVDGEAEPDTLQLKVGDTRSLLPFGWIFEEQGAGLCYLAVPDAAEVQVEACGEDVENRVENRILRFDKGNITGLQVATVRVRLSARGCSEAVGVTVLGEGREEHSGGG